MKMEKEFIYHMSELPNLGVCGYRWVYYKEGRKWTYYSEDPFGNRHRMKKNIFLDILSKIKVERIDGYNGKKLT